MVEGVQNMNALEKRRQRQRQASGPVMSSVSAVVFADRIPGSAAVNSPTGSYIVTPAVSMSPVSGDA